MEWYQETFIDTGRSAATWATASFITTFLITRAITRRIRAKEASADTEGGLSNVHIGGVHVHHQVWGILLVLVSGLLQIRFSPGAPWAEVLAVLFGSGAALALDEFALWFHLDDVYWAEEGRKSIDAILIGAALGLALIMQATPVGGDADAVEQLGVWVYLTVLAFHLATALVCFLKGKLATGLVGIVIPIIATVGAIRLAKPDSFWARRRYDDAKLARSRRRFGAAYAARRDRLRDIAGGHLTRPRADDQTGRPETWQ